LVQLVETTQSPYPSPRFESVTSGNEAAGVLVCQFQLA
jgi:hypothetical protein